MRTAIILSGLSAFVAAQSSESSIYWDADLQSSISAAVAAASSGAAEWAATAVPSITYTPEQLMSINSVAQSVATAAQGAQSSIIDAQVSSVLGWQSSAEAELASVTAAIASASGGAKSSLAEASRSITSVIASASNAASQITSIGASASSKVAASASSAVSSATSNTDNAAAATAVPIFAAGAFGAVGLAIVGLL